MSQTPVSGTSSTMSTDRVEDREVDVFEKLMRSSLKDVRIDREGDIHGFCETEEDVVHLLSSLRVHGYAYSVRRSAYYRQPPSGAAKHETGFFYSHTKGNIPIQFFGPVFCVESLVKRECTLGPLYHKKETPVADHLVDHVNPKKKRKVLMDTQKKGCPATFDVKCVRIFPDYAINSATDSSKKRVLCVLVPHLKAAFRSAYLVLLYCMGAMDKPQAKFTKELQLQITLATSR
ncbi:uncharacterized protein LOC126412258 [Schistocerca serialis cubense]|uniref:uncharacterized protein LOC126412258 n=1 Tax=Schistocerca serialis cubense TaxID=2023355 RepID=UPI00214ECE79|nr:uncharacterized protein LOC126412258 [Schistocerca serialis cubense]